MDKKIFGVLVCFMYNKLMDKPNKTTAETITDAQIRTLRSEAESAGDSAMVLVCSAALGEEAACRRLSRVGHSRATGPWFRGHHLDGAGPARFGWARAKVAGGCEYLGRTLAEIARAECTRAIVDATAQY